MPHFGLKWTFLQYLAVKAHLFLLISSDYWKKCFFAPSLFNQISVLFRHLDKSKSNTCSHFLKSLRVNYGSIREFWHPFHLGLLNLFLLDLNLTKWGEKKTQQNNNQNTFAHHWSSVCVLHISRSPLVCSSDASPSLCSLFFADSLRTWLVFNAAVRAWTPLRFSDVIVDLVFIWCIAFSILGYLFHVDLKKECCVLVILKCCLQHCGHSVYRWRMKPHHVFLLPWAPNM